MADYQPPSHRPSAAIQQPILPAFLYEDSFWHKERRTAVASGKSSFFPLLNVFVCFVSVAQRISTVSCEYGAPRFHQSDRELPPSEHDTGGAAQFICDHWASEILQTDSKQDYRAEPGFRLRGLRDGPGRQKSDSDAERTSNADEDRKGQLRAPVIGGHQERQPLHLRLAAKLRAGRAGRAVQPVRPHHHQQGGDRHGHGPGQGHRLRALRPELAGRGRDHVSQPVDSGRLPRPNHRQVRQRAEDSRAGAGRRRQRLDPVARHASDAADARQRWRWRRWPVGNLDRDAAAAARRSQHRRRADAPRAGVVPLQPAGLHAHAAPGPDGAGGILGRQRRGRRARGAERLVPVRLQHPRGRRGGASLPAVRPAWRHPLRQGHQGLYDGQEQGLRLRHDGQLRGGLQRHHGTQRPRRAGETPPGIVQDIKELTVLCTGTWLSTLSLSWLSTLSLSLSRARASAYTPLFAAVPTVLCAPSAGQGS